MNGKCQCEAMVWPTPKIMPFQCERAARYTVERLAGPKHLCGIHVKRWRAWEGVAGPLGVTIKECVT
jgi:hypothetical protein